MIRAILFDADGVLQRPQPFRRALWARLLGDDEASVDAFLQEVFAEERPCYCGGDDFAARLHAVLTRWNRPDELPSALEAWTAIEVDRHVLDAVRGLRTAGYRCYLASNQEPHRARYMSESLAYRTEFDREFYSCTVGHAKPDAHYFTSTIASIGIRPQEALFIDDSAANIEAASSVGLRTALFAPAPGDEWHRHLEDILREHGCTVR